MQLSRITDCSYSLNLPETYTVETEAAGESYMPVNEDPLQLEHALIEVTPGCNDHMALLYNSGGESQVIYEVILGRTSESAIIVHPTDATTNPDHSLSEVRIHKHSISESI